VASIADLVEEPALKHLATEDAYAQGANLAANGSVHSIKAGPLGVTAHVEDTGSYTVELVRTDDDKLSWSCTCQEAQRGTFCKHCVATGIETWRQAPPRRE
jgi:uncharacterized Zn finger protein